MKSRRSSRRWAFALAAAIGTAAVALLLFTRNASPLERLVALAPRAARVVEPRLSGGFAWARYDGANRATEGTTNAAGLKLAGAAGELLERADHDPDTQNQHAAGVATILVGKAADAIARLEAAAGQSTEPPLHARMWSDLAAARYAAASRFDRASLYPLALAASDSALHLAPQLPEALFNRALILQRLGLTEEARRAWQRYLDVDASSPWAAEVRTRLAGLPSSTRSSQFERDRPRLEEAAERGDARTVRTLVDAHRDRARAYAEAEYLGQWGEAVQRGDAAAARRWLTIARAIGDAVAELSGDALTREAVRAIDHASVPDRKTIATAHALYRRGRMAYHQRELEAAERDLRQAAASFEAVRDPMALSARYYAAGVRLSRNETDAARSELERIRADVDLHPTFLNLRAHVRWELGRTLMFDDDWSGAAPVLTEGAALFRQSGERASEAFLESLLAHALSSMGRADVAWLARMRAFAALSAEGEPALLATSVDEAMHAELLAGRGEAALALSVLAVDVARASAQPPLVLAALTNASMLQAISGHRQDALRLAEQAEGIARATTDAAQRERQLADLATATGAALAETNPRGAFAPLTRAIDFYRGHDLPFALPEPLLLRARCALRAGDRVAAMRDLEEGIAIVGRHRSEGAGMPAASSILDADHALFTDAIRLSLERNDAPAAFAFAETLRGAAITTAELQRRLAGSGAVVLEIVALPDELITFAVSERGVAVARRDRSRATLASLAAACLTEEKPAAASLLFDEVIRPVETVLDRAHALILVPDRSLQGMPFAALYDRTAKQYLVERFTVSVAPSASALQPEPASSAPPSAAAIALPTAGPSDAGALPEAEREIAEVAALYRQASTIHASAATLAALWSAARADVLHIAGHTEVQPGGGEQALLLAGREGNALERVSSKSILAASPIHAGVVVLAACETLRPPASTATQTSSLAEAFLTAGARDVIGTLAPIGDRDARLFFTGLHRRLAHGERAADALRAVQREAIALDSENPEARGRRAWRAVALLTRSIPTRNVGKETTTWPHNH